MNQGMATPLKVNPFACRFSGNKEPNTPLIERFRGTLTTGAQRRKGSRWEPHAFEAIITVDEAYALLAEAGYQMEAEKIYAYELPDS